MKKSRRVGRGTNEEEKEVNKGRKEEEKKREGEGENRRSGSYLQDLSSIILNLS